MAFCLHSKLQKICCASLQFIPRDNCSACSCSLGVSTGGAELRIFLLCLLDLEPLNICSIEGKKRYFLGFIPYKILASFLYYCACSLLFSSVAQSCPTLCDPMNCSRPGLPVHHQLPEFTQTHVHRVGAAIQPSHPLSSSSPPAPNPSQHQSLFQWVNSSHEVAKVLEFQLQHQSFQRTPRTDLL